MKSLTALTKKLQNASHKDEDKLLVLYKLIDLNFDSALPESRKYAEMALELAKKNVRSKGADESLFQDGDYL